MPRRNIYGAAKVRFSFVSPRPLFDCSRSHLPPFVTERRCQKCPQGTSVGIGQRFSLSGRKTTFSRRTQRPLADFAEPPQSKRRKGLRRKSGVFCARSVSAGVVTRCFSPCLIFWCFWIKTKAHKKEYAPQKKSILRKEFRRQDRLRRICGPKAAGHAHGGGPPQAETSTRTAQRPAIFQAGLWGFARPKPGLHGTLLREFPKSSFKQEISARPAPFRPARPSRHPEGQQTYRKEHTPPDKQREPFPMKRFPFSFPRRIPPDPA